MKNLFSLFVIITICVQVSLAQTFPVNGGITTVNGVGVNVCSEYLNTMYLVPNTKYIEINTNLPFQNHTSMTSFYIDYWGYNRCWRIKVGWYIYNNSFYSPTFSLDGIYTHDEIKLANKNGKISIYIPRSAVAIYGMLSVNSMTKGLVAADWADNWTVQKSADPPTTNLTTLKLENKISTKGNIGIGTTTPDEKLSVNGNIHTKEVRVDLTGWSDFVFEENYDLPTLQEVEAHIKEKGHLENIPSAKEVEADGIKLGEMNAKLLQKIEELTLYTIEQEKQFVQLKEMIAIQQNEIKKMSKLIEEISK